MKTLVSVFLTVFLVCATFSVSYGDDNDGTSWYLGLLGLNAFENFDSGPIDFDDSFGLGLKGGVRLTQSDKVDFALELSLNWYDSFDSDFQGVSAEIDLWSVTVRPKLYISGIADGRFEPYVYLGVGYMMADATVSGLGLSASIDDTGFIYELGGGLEFSITDAVGVFTEVGYVEPTGDLDGLSFWTIGAGVTFRF